MRDMERCVMLVGHCGGALGGCGEASFHKPSMSEGRAEWSVVEMEEELVWRRSLV